MSKKVKIIKSILKIVVNKHKYNFNKNTKGTFKLKLQNR